jgi:hypothetical protein
MVRPDLAGVAEANENVLGVVKIKSDALPSNGGTLRSCF